MKKLFATLAATTALVSCCVGSRPRGALHQGRPWPRRSPVDRRLSRRFGWWSLGHKRVVLRRTSPYRPGSCNTSGWTAGGIVGANIQVAIVVIGVEFDGNWADVTGSKAIGTRFSGLRHQSLVDRQQDRLDVCSRSLGIFVRQLAAVHRGQCGNRRRDTTISTSLRPTCSMAWSIPATATAPRASASRLAAALISRSRQIGSSVADISMTISERRPAGLSPATFNNEVFTARYAHVARRSCTRVRRAFYDPFPVN